jgi:2-hydroxy-3-keto-5-methylthiopentenyl-1-phosphate phosphatase
MGFRHGAIKFLKTCQTHFINLAIVDGGLSDVIGLMLDSIIYLKDYEELTIVANDLSYNDWERLDRYNLKVNSMCKSFAVNEAVIGNRKNIILMGDCLEDTNMVANIDYTHLIKIGFLNTPKDLEKELNAYLEKYDIVIVNDGSFDLPN